MESKTIDYWEKLIQNPPENFKNDLVKEEKFLKNNLSKKDVVLDIGCGTGRTMKILNGLCKEIIGVDNDIEAIKRCKENIKMLTNVKIILEDAEKMNFSDNFFDKIIISGTTFGNFGDTWDKILFEIKRVLKPEGVFLFSIYNENALKNRLKVYERYNKGEFTIEKKGKVVFTKGFVSEQFSEKEIRKILEKTGFEIEEIRKEKIFYLIKCRKRIR